MIYLVSDIDNKEYLVRNLPDSKIAVNILAKIKQNIHKIATYLFENKSKYPENEKYIIKLYNGIQNSLIEESSENTVYTSYSVNKGEEIVFCLRSKLVRNQIHDFNLIMYVVLHEMAHIGCPEIGHTDLFKKIFGFLATEAVKLNLYKKIEFDKSNTEYCGLTITDSII
jgi:predicted metal-dependent hydrolase